jgi:hypothetical protein
MSRLVHNELATGPIGLTEVSAVSQDFARELLFDLRTADAVQRFSA